MQQDKIHLNEGQKPPKKVGTDRPHLDYNGVMSALERSWLLLVLALLSNCVTPEIPVPPSPAFPRLTLPIQASSPTPIEPASDPDLGPSGDFFERMAIEVPGGQQARFVVTDNVRGYYEGWTSTYRRGAGYLIGNQAVFLGFGAGVGGKLLNRTLEEARQLILPWGLRAIHPKGTEELVVHSGYQALSLTVSSPEQADLALVALLEANPETTEFQPRDSCLVLALDHSGLDNPPPAFLAVTLDRDGVLTTDPQRLPPDLVYDLSLEGGKAFLGATGRGHALTLHLAFADSADEAARLVLTLAQKDAIGETQKTWFRRLTANRLWTDDARFNQALLWAEIASWGFYVEEFGKGLWAGLPWFRDNWGRDTFIAMPGTFLVTGHHRDAKLVIENFLQYQNKGGIEGGFNTLKDVGRIPNRVKRGEIIYNTVDGTPLMLKAIREYIAYSGDRAFGLKVLPAVRLYLESSLQHWVDSEGLLTHDDADTWMDARIAGRQPWSARGNRAIEIQALWYQALLVGAELEEWAGNVEAARRWRDLATRVRAAVLRRFWNGQELADRLGPDGSADFKPRPNVFIALAYPFQTEWLGAEIEWAALDRLVPRLVYPYGVSSLGIDHPYFHPRHEYPGRYHKDAAYHNGALWGWLAGPTITLLTRWGRQDFAYLLTQNLADQLLEQGALGTLSENANAEPGPEGRPVLTGAFSQSWSVAEFVRNAYQDYLGLRPDLVRQRLTLAPRWPRAWSHLRARLLLGQGWIELEASQSTDVQTWRIQTRGLPPLTLVFEPLDREGGRRRAEVALRADTAVRLQWNGAQLRIGEQVLATAQAAPPPRLGELRFVEAPADWSAFPMVREPNALQKIILEGRFE